VPHIHSCKLQLDTHTTKINHSQDTHQKNSGTSQAMNRWDKPRPTIFATLLPHIFHNLILLFIILQLIGRHNLPFPPPPHRILSSDSKHSKVVAMSRVLHCLNCLSLMEVLWKQIWYIHSRHQHHTAETSGSCDVLLQTTHADEQ
jgi:hypothetical protein